MRKKTLIITTILIVALLATLIVGCNEVKTNKDYYLYTYDATQGEYVQSAGKIVFDDENYSVYANNGQVTNVGEHSNNNGVLTLVPDKIGVGNDQMAARTSMYLYDEFIVSPASLVSRVAETAYVDRSDLEGVYNNNIKLHDGNVYESIDGSNINSSFTEKVGTYALNKKDFVNIYLDNGTVSVLLIIEYTDAFGYTVKGLATSFYSYKDPKIEAVTQSAVEMKQTVFLNTSTGGGSANYDLSLISYPNKNDVTGDVTYSIVGTNASASLSGSTLSYNGTGQVQIEYTYGNIVDTAWIYIVDMVILPNNTITYSVGATRDFDDMLSDLTTYSSFWFTYESVEISDKSLAESSNGVVTFKAAGTVNVTLVARFVTTKLDGSKEVVEKTVSTNVTIT